MSVLTNVKKKQKNTHKTIVFISCLFVSSFMWLYVELGKVYEVKMNYILTMENTPKNMLLVDNKPISISMNISAGGYDIVAAKYLKKTKNLKIDLKHAKTVFKDGGIYSIIYLNKNKDSFLKQISYAKSINFIYPDSVSVKFSTEVSRKIPVKVNVDLALNTQYDIVDSIKYTPREVTVYSIKEVIDTMKFVYTEPIKFKNIDTNVNLRLPLIKDIYKGMARFKPDTISLSMKVAKTTEAAVKCKIEVETSLKHIKIFPDMATIYYKVPLEKYNLIDTTQFKLKVNIENNTSKKASIKIIQNPKNVIITRIEPTDVEFIEIVE